MAAMQASPHANGKLKNLKHLSVSSGDERKIDSGKANLENIKKKTQLN